MIRKKRKTLGRNDMHGRITRRKPLLTNLNTKTLLKFQQTNKKKKKTWSPRLGKNILWTDEAKVKIFGRFESCYIWHKTDNILLKKNNYSSCPEGQAHLGYSTGKWYETPLNEKKKKINKKIKVLEWPHQSSDLNQIEILGITLKKAIHVHKPIMWLSIHSILIRLSLLGSREGWSLSQLS